MKKYKPIMTKDGDTVRVVQDSYADLPEPFVHLGINTGAEDEGDFGQAVLSLKQARELARRILEIVEQAEKGAGV